MLALKANRNPRNTLHAHLPTSAISLTFCSQNSCSCCTAGWRERRSQDLQCRRLFSRKNILFSIFMSPTRYDNAKSCRQLFARNTDQPFQSSVAWAPPTSQKYVSFLSCTCHHLGNLSSSPSPNLHALFDFRLFPLFILQLSTSPIPTILCVNIPVYYPFYY